MKLSEEMRKYLETFDYGETPMAEWANKAALLEGENAALKRYISSHPSGKTSMAEFDEWYEIVKKNDALLTAEEQEVSA